MKCKSCKWCGPNPNEDVVSVVCRRYPPKINFSDIYNFGLWPMVRKDDWCGEYVSNDTG